MYVFHSHFYSRCNILHPADDVTSVLCAPLLRNYGVVMLSDTHTVRRMYVQTMQLSNQII